MKSFTCLLEIIPSVIREITTTTTTITIKSATRQIRKISSPFGFESRISAFSLFCAFIQRSPGGERREMESRAKGLEQCAGLAIRRPRVQVPPGLLAGFLLDSPEFKSSAMLITQPAGLPPTSWDS